MSTARRRRKSPPSPSGTSTHPTMVTLVNIMIWMDDSHPFRSMSFSRPVPEIKLFQTLTLKLPRSRSWVWSGRLKKIFGFSAKFEAQNVFFIHSFIPKFRLQRSALGALDFHMPCMWSKGKVIQSAQNHINSLTFHFKSIRPIILEIKLFQNLTLKHPRSRTWVRSKVKVTYYTRHATDALTFVSHKSDQPLLRYGQNSVLPWKTPSEFFKNLPK